MKFFLAVLLIVGVGVARADLYRWVDPQSGSVTYSSVPPPASQSGVEMIPYRSSAAPANPTASAPAPQPTALELRWQGLLAEISAIVPGSAGVPQRIQDFAAVSAELDRLDPAGAARRRAEAQAVLQRLLKVQK